MKLAIGVLLLGVSIAAVCAFVFVKAAERNDVETAAYSAIWFELSAFGILCSLIAIAVVACVRSARRAKENEAASEPPP